MKQSKIAIVLIVGVLVVAGAGWYAYSRSKRSMSKDNNTGKIIPVPEPTNVNKTAPEYIGLSEKEATDKAKSANKPNRVVRRDGETYVLSADYDTGRINFEIENGNVTKAEYY